MGRDLSHARDMASFHTTECICCMVSSLRVTWLMMWHDSSRDVTHNVTWLITRQVLICNLTPYVTWIMLWHDSLYDITHNVTWLIHGIVALRDMTHWDMTHYVTCLDVSHRYVTQRVIFYSFYVIQVIYGDTTLHVTWLLTCVTHLLTWLHSISLHGLIL